MGTMRKSPINKVYTNTQRQCKACGRGLSEKEQSLVRAVSDRAHRREMRRRMLIRIYENPGLTARELFSEVRFPPYGYAPHPRISGNCGLHEAEQSGQIIWGENARRETLDGGRVKGWYITDEGVHWATTVNGEEI